MLHAMVRGVWRVVTMATVIFGGAALCGGGVLYYGKLLSEAEVAEGTLRAPEEMRRVLDEIDRRFRAMTPAEHLAEARREIDCGYDPVTRMGGNFRGAERHLEAIPEGVETVAVSELRALIAQRREERSAAVVAKLGELCQTTDELHGAEASLVGEARQAALRRRFARRLDHFAASVLGCVHTEGEDDATLRFDSATCDAAMIDRHVPPAQRPALRALGFARIRCRNGAAEVGL
jgi:hypothetical protein